MDRQDRTMLEIVGFSH